VRKNSSGACLLAIAFSLVSNAHAAAGELPCRQSRFSFQNRDFAHAQTEIQAILNVKHSYIDIHLTIHKPTIPEHNMDARGCTPPRDTERMEIPSPVERIMKISKHSSKHVKNNAVRFAPYA